MSFPVAEPPASPPANAPQRRRSSSVSFSSSAIVSGPQSPPMSPHSPNAGASPMRRRSSMIRAAFRLTRDSFYTQFSSAGGPFSGVESMGDDGGKAAPILAFCANQLTTAALALTALLSNEGPVTAATTVTVECIFHTIQLPLHYALRPSLTMHEVFAILSDFMDADPRFSAFRLRMTTFDVRRVDNDTAETSTSDSCPRQHNVTVSDLRSELMRDVINSGRQMLIFYDTFTLLNNVAVEAGSSDDEFRSDGAVDARDTEGGPQPVSQAGSSVSSSRLYRAMVACSVQESPGTDVCIEARSRCALVKDINPTHLVVHMVQASLNSFDPEKNFVVSFVDAPLTALHTAMAARDHETGRAHGFITIERDAESENSSAADEELNTSTLLNSPNRSFRVSTRVMENCLLHHLSRFPASWSRKAAPLLLLNNHTARHLTSLALLVHLMRRTEQVDINSIAERLALPLEVVYSNSLRAVQVFPYFKRYLASQELKVKLVPLPRQSQRVGAPSTLSVTDLSRVLQRAVSAQSILDDTCRLGVICSFDLNIVHGTIGVEHSHDTSIGYAVLAGYDAQLERALMVDPQPKQFTPVWEVPVDRLHQAMSDHGFFLVGTADADLDIVPDHQDKEVVALALEAVPPDLLPPATLLNEEALSFDAPLVLGAIAVSSLGLPLSVHALLWQSPCNVTHLLSRHMSISDYARVLNYVVAGRGGITAAAHRVGDAELGSLAQFEAFVSAAHATPSTALVFSFATRAASVRSVPSPRRCAFGLLIGLSDGDNDRCALLLQCHRDAAQRRQWVRLSALYSACAELCTHTHRPRGLIAVRVGGGGPVGASVYSSRPAADMFMVPMAQPFQPLLCPQLTAIALALTTLLEAEAGAPRGSTGGIFPEEIFYNVFSGPEMREEGRFATLRAELDADAVANITNEFCAAKLAGYTAAAVSLDALRALQVAGATAHVSAHLTASQTGATIILYSPRVTHRQRHLAEERGAGVITVCPASAGTLLVCDAEPSCNPEYWEVSIEVLMAQMEHGDASLVRVTPQ